MSFRYRRREEEFSEIAKGLGLKWWFLALVALWILVSTYALI